MGKPRRKPGANSAEEKQLEGVLSIAADAVDELLTRHESEMQLDLREKFFALVSHDLRTPLTSAKASAELIRRHPENLKVCLAQAERIVSVISRAERMIADLLDANRARAGARLAIRPEKCDLAESIKRLLEDLEVVYPGRCRLVAPSGPVEGHWDAQALCRALENLITNAIKYGSAAAPVTISLERREAGGGVSLSVHNQGSKIAATDLTTIFNWHTRTKAAQRSGKAGWGLGLMLVKGIAQAHGGSVYAESSAKGGTRFTIEVPIDSRPFAA